MPQGFALSLVACRCALFADSDSTRSYPLTDFVFWGLNAGGMYICPSNSGRKTTFIGLHVLLECPMDFLAVFNQCV